MKIKYIWHDKPHVEKVVDTERTLRGCAGLNRMMHFEPTQQEWDEIELRNMKRDHERGLVLRYEVIG